MYSPKSRKTNRLGRTYKNNEKNHEIYILTCIERFSKYPSAEVSDNANASNVIIFLDNYIHMHGVSRSLPIDQARCLIGNQVKKFCMKKISPSYQRRETTIEQ